MPTPVDNAPRVPTKPVKTEPRRPDKDSSATPSAKDTDKPSRGGTGASIGALVGATIRDIFGGSTKPKPPRRQDGTSDLPVPTGEAAELAKLGESTKSGKAWDPKQNDLTTGRNAHRSNTPEEMREALEGDHNWLEGDLRIDKKTGKPVMSHDEDKTGEGLTLDEWLAIGGKSERGLKVDVKEKEAIPQLLDAIEKSGVPDGRIMLNVADVSDDEVRDMRRRFPDAWLALNPTVREDGYHKEDLDAITRQADIAGGRVAFPVRWDVASDDVIKTLKPHGKVSIWTANSQGTPDDTAGERQRLLDRGVDGVIDLGPPQGFWDKLKVDGMNIWQSGPVRGARGFAGDVKDGAVAVYHEGKDLVEDGLDIAGAGLDVAREGASHLPLVGGLFD